MNRLLIAFVFFLSSSSLLLLDSTIKGSLILLLAASLVWLLRRDSAATRHLVWLVAVIAVLVVPVFSNALPHWRILPAWAELSSEPRALVSNKTPAPQQHVAQHQLPAHAPIVVESPPDSAISNSQPAQSATETAAALELESPIYHRAVASETQSVPAPENLAEEIAAPPGLISLRVLSLLWFVGASALVLRLLAARLLLLNTERQGMVIAVSNRRTVVPNITPTDNTAYAPRLIASFKEAVEQLRIQQRVSLIVHKQRTIPLVWGAWRSRLMLPLAIKDWSDDQLKSVLLHELAHIQRRDTLSQLLSQTACAVYWFNPLVWVAAWRLHVERERACDDLVLANGVTASTYAEHLLNVATRLTSPPWNQACGLAMARRSSLEGRLKAVLNETRNRRRLTNVIVVISVLLGGAIVVPIAMLRAADQQQAEASDVGAEETKPDGDEPRANEVYSTDDPPLPSSERAQLLLSRWQAIEERNDKLKNSTIDRLRRGIDSWLGQKRPAEPVATALLEVRDWKPERDEHPIGEIVAWLDRITSIEEGPVQFALNGERHVSRKLTNEERKLWAFGPIAQNGLRAAWGRSPVQDVYRIGDVIECSLVIQNTTQEPIEFACAYSLSNVVRWNATDQNEEKVDVKEVWLTGTVPLVRFHVKPGEVAEIKGYGGLTIGATEPQPLLQLNAKAGQRVTVQWQVRTPVEMTTAPVSFQVAEAGADKPTNVVVKDEPPVVEEAQDGEPPIGIKLSTETEQQLQWGEPVNGLRGALSRLPSLGSAKTGYTDFDLVLQNVSEQPVRLIANVTTPDRRMIRIRQDGATLQGLRSGKPSNVDLTLQPREVIVLPVFLPAESESFEQDGRALADEPGLTFYGVMEVPEAPTGAWSGKLRTPDVSGDVISGKPANALKTISAALEEKLQWGEPVDGLRAAVMIRDVSDNEQDVMMIVQNVSQSELRINDTNEENEHILFEKLDGELQSAFSSKMQRFGDVLLQPREVAYLSVFPPRSDPGRPTGDLMSEILIKTNNHSAYGTLQFLHVSPGTWSGELRTGETTGIQAAPISLQFGENIDSATEERLRWGEPSNGLRAALAIRDSAPDLYLAVQNVQELPVHLHDKIAVRGGRMLAVYQDDLLQSRTRIDQPTLANVLLQPRQVVYLEMAPIVFPSDSTKSKGQLLARAMLNKSDMQLIGEMTIANSRPGAWTGHLVTGKTGAKAAKPGPMLNSETAQSLYQLWLSNRRLNGKIPGGQLRSLAKATSNFVEYNPTDKRTPKLTQLLSRMNVDRDWTQAEAIALLNDVTATYDNLPKWASDLSRFEISETIRTGEPLPATLENAPWGEPHASGLRTAWLLDPPADEYRLNTPLKSRILYHNNGNETVFFRVVSWNQSASHQAHDAKGVEIQTLSTSWTTIGQVTAVRLAPGQFTEVIGAGIGVGANVNGEDWRNTRVGTWIHAKEGDVVTFTPDAVTMSGSDGRQRNVEDGVWWETFISQRLQRDTPLPADAKERERILTRAVSDLFGMPPTEEQTKDFLADDSSDAISELAKRLSERAGTTWVFGKLESGPTTFRVLPVAPEAKHKPYLAVGPGRYKFEDRATLVIVGRGQVMDAKLEFESSTGADSYAIELPEGRGKWAIAWKPGLTKFWIAEPGVLRSVDFTKPKTVVETRFTDPTSATDISEHFLSALQPTFTVKQPAAPPAAAADVQRAIPN